MFAIIIDIILLILALNKFIIDIVHYDIIKQHLIIISIDFAGVALMLCMLLSDIFIVTIKRFLKNDKTKQLIRDILKDKEH